MRIFWVASAATTATIRVQTAASSPRTARPAIPCWRWKTPSRKSSLTWGSNSRVPGRCQPGGPRMKKSFLIGLVGLLIALALSFPPAATAALPQDTKKSPTAKNEECLACHGQQGMQGAKGRSIFVDAAKQAASVHGGLNCSACHAGVKEYPHPKPMPRVNCATCHAEAPAQVAQSIHSALGAQACASCHGSAHQIKRAAQITPQQCAACHAEQVSDYQASVHARA